MTDSGVGSQTVASVRFDQTRPAASDQLDALTKTTALLCERRVALLMLRDIDGRLVTVFPTVGGESVRALADLLGGCVPRRGDRDDAWIDVIDVATDRLVRQLADRFAIQSCVGVTRRLDDGRTLSLFVGDQGREALTDDARATLRSCLAAAGRLIAAHEPSAVSDVPPIVDLDLIGTWQLNVQTDEIDVSDDWARQCGYSRAELLPLSAAKLASIYHPGDYAAARAEFARFLRGETDRFEFLIRKRHRNGFWLPVITRGRVATRAANGCPETILGTHQEVGRVANETSALRKSEDFLHRIGAIAGVGGWELNLVTDELYWSSHTRILHGVDLTYVPTVAKAIEFYAPEARPIIEAAVARSIATGEPWDLELPLIRTDGRRIWVRAVGSPEYANGTMIRLIGALQDVTQRINERIALQHANDRVTLATDSAGIGIAEWNLASGVPVWDMPTRWLHGLTVAERAPTYKEWRHFIHPEDVLTVDAALAAALRDGRLRAIEYRIIRRDGGVRHVRSSGYVEFDADCRAIRLVSAHADVTDEREVAAELVRQCEFMRITLQSIGDGVITTDTNGTVTWLNPIAEALTHWSAAEAKGQPIAAVFSIVDEQTGDPIDAPLTVASRTRDTALRARGGMTYVIEGSAAPIEDAAGQMVGSVIVFRNVTEQRETLRAVNFRASHDQLTGLPNRAALLTHLESAVHEALQLGTLLAVLFVDLDGFKNINDTFGHAVGDTVLVAAATRMKDTLRRADFVARLGGDEFVIVSTLLGSDADADAIAQKVIDAIAEPLEIEALPDIAFAASVGVAVCPADGRDAPTLLRNADLAMYEAKQLGRNGYRRSGRSQTAPPSNLARRIASGIEKHEFCAYYQPIVDLRTGRIAGMEALIRWNHPSLGLLSPAQFLDVAARARLIGQLDQTTLRFACAQAAVWNAAGSEPALTVFVNVDETQFTDPNFTARLNDALVAAQVDPRALGLELPAALLARNDTRLHAKLRACAARGIQLAIGDFGPSNRDAIARAWLPSHTFKLDRSLVLAIGRPAAETSNLRALIASATSLGGTVTATGVETASQLRFFAEAGCERVQGFLIAQPMTVRAATQFIAGFDERRFTQSGRRRSDR